MIDSGALQPDLVAQWYYKYCRSELICQAVNGSGRLVERLSRRSPRIRSTDIFLLYSEVLKEANTRFIGAWDPGEFLQKPDGKLLPIPNIPSTLRRPVDSLASLVLRSKILSPVRHEANEILDSSILNNHKLPLRTVAGPTFSIIHGRYIATVHGFACLAHELGHCLAERHLPNRSLTDQVLSEAVAMIVESALLSEESLSNCPTVLSAWRRYQNTIDRLNLYFCEYEAAEYFPQHFTFRHTPIFDLSAHFLRESLVVVPGYQLVYLAASCLRNVILSKSKTGEFYWLEPLKRLLKEIPLNLG